MGHIIDPLNHPEMEDYEEQLKEAVQTSTGKQDLLNPQKYRYSKKFENLPANNIHIVTIVLFRLQLKAELSAFANFLEQGE